MVEQYEEFIGYMPEGSSVMEKIRGTIQEVLNRLSTLSIHAEQVRFYSDDGTNAECMFCRRK